MRDKDLEVLGLDFVEWKSEPWRQPLYSRHNEGSDLGFLLMVITDKEPEETSYELYDTRADIRARALYHQKEQILKVSKEWHNVVSSVREGALSKILKELRHCQAEVKTCMVSEVRRLMEEPLAELESMCTTNNQENNNGKV